MIQSTLSTVSPSFIHAAIIMDGNGRWANHRKLPRIEGHLEGAKAVRRTLEACPDLGINTLTVYAFSSDNWKRPQNEVQSLMKLFYDYLHSEKQRCLDSGVRISVIGRRDRLSLPLRAAIATVEKATVRCTKVHFRIAIDYSSQDAILHAAKKLNTGKPVTRETFSYLLGRAYNTKEPAPDVDLLIRTAGEKRLSDFLLWECSYAEFYFTDCLWPDFGQHELEMAVKEFHRRSRKFGALPVAANV